MILEYHMLTEWWCEVKRSNVFVGLCLCGCLCTFKDVPEVENQVNQNDFQLKSDVTTLFCLFQVGSSRVQTGSDLPLCFDEATTNGWIHRLIICLHMLGE